MKKTFSIIVSVSILLGALDADAFRLVDAETKAPLHLASITDRSGNVVGMTDKSGVIPELQKDRYPITFNYYPKIIWWKNGDITRWYGDALANEKNHTTSPWALKLLGLTTDVTEISDNFVFDTPDGDVIRPADLRQVSITIDMLAKGKLFKKTLDSSSPVNVRTYMELYLTDREFLSEEEGKSLKKETPSIVSSEIKAPTNANPLHPAIRRTVERINSLCL